MLHAEKQIQKTNQTLRRSPKGTTMRHRYPRAALTAFQLPRLVGQTDDGQDIKANIGRFGPYVQVGKTFVSIKPLDPHTITLEEAWRPTQKKLAKDAAKHINRFTSGIKVLNGPYGPYVTDGKERPYSQRRRCRHSNRGGSRNYSPPHRQKGRFKRRAPTKSLSS